MTAIAARFRASCLTAILGLVATAPSLAPGLSAQDRPTLGPDDYGKWEQLGRTEVSPDGSWLAVSIGRVNDEDELRVHRTDADSVVVVAYGSGQTFSRDSRWLLYTIGRSEEERDEARRAERPVRDDVGIFDLGTGTVSVREAVQSFRLSADGRFAALRRYKPEDQDHEGVDLIVEELATGERMVFGNVSDARWADEGHLLAITLDAADRVGNGVSLYDPDSGSLRLLDQAEATYRQMRWREDTADLAVLRTVEDEAFEDTTHVALVWQDLDQSSPRSFTLDGGSHPQLATHMRIVEHRAPSWSDDGTVVFLGLQERRPAPEPCEETTEDAGDGSTPTEDCDDNDQDDETPGVEIWHARDLDPIPQQRVREQQLREQNHISAWHLDRDAFVQLGDDHAERTSLVPGGRHVIGMDETPYEEDAMFRQQFLDLYAIDVGSGAKTLIENRVPGNASGSPGGRYVVWFEGEHWFAYALEQGRTHNLTEGIGAQFVNLDLTPTREQMPSFGIAGWLEDDAAILLNDRWDVWEVQLDGSGGRALTSGAEGDVRYRLVDLDPEADAFDADAPLYYHAYSEWTKEAGYARAQRGAEPTRLIWADKSFGGFGGGLLEAKDADVLVFRQEGFDDSPDLFVAGPDLRDPRQVTRTNPFQADYAWGRTELVDYENEWGRRLQGVLTYPADYEPGRTYPLVVYHYELLSQGMHQYQVPDPTRYYNQQIWSHEGYFVFRPDIVYRDRRPGQSNVETLRPALDAVLATGLIDEERMGLIGHSWGGYQTTFFVTQDDRFAAAVAGAPLTNLMSMYLSFYWNSGGTDARIFEISQGRMQVPWWEDWDSYFNNSPVHHIQNMETPLLMMFGTDDGAVEFNQGVEFYNAARRLRKDMVFLAYEGENHGLAEEPNQRDYQSRILEWFAHYLKGEPAPAWIETGLDYLEQKDGARRPAS
ncbi:MAG: prolyl oligopeptidase family serine peptidase [Gemmatimonadota bacterium]